MMNEKELMKRALAPLHASEDTLKEVQIMMEKRNHSTAPRRKYILTAAVVAVALALSITAYAVGSVILSEVRSWNNRTLIEHVLNENGEEECHVTYSADDVAPVTKLRDGRLYFIVNDENIDITDTISEDTPFHYDYTDPDGNIHYFIVGGTIDHVGYSEIIKAADGNWLGGYATNLEQPGDTQPASPAWYELGKENISCPW